MKLLQGFRVRFKGHLCAAVKTGFSRKFILMRLHKDKEPFLSKVESWPDPPDQEYAERVARIDCARAIKRTEWARRKLQGDHFLRGVPSVERVLRDYGTPHRRGKRWKICPIYSQCDTPA